MDERAAKGTPYVFAGLPGALTGPYDEIVLPERGENHDWELELAAVIGKPARHLTRENALDHVAGYTICNDITTRSLVYRKDLKAIGSDWFAAKNAPTFLPTGPYLVPARFAGDPASLRVTLRHNGITRQDESTAGMLFDLPAILAYVTEVIELRPGDLVLGLASSGLHSNGYSLVRKIVFERAGLKVGDFVPELGRTVGEELLEPTRIYVRAIKSILHHYPVKRRVVRGLAHITGEGLEGNVPRVLPPGRRVFLSKGSWPVPPVFAWLQKLGPVEEKEMFRVFNMGIGFVVIVGKYYADSVQRQLEDERVKTYIIGEVREGEPGVEFVE